MKFMRIVLTLSLIWQFIPINSIIAGENANKKKADANKIQTKKAPKENKSKKHNQKKDISAKPHKIKTVRKSHYTAPDTLAGNLITLKKAQESHFEACKNMYSENVRQCLEDPNEKYTLERYLHELKYAAEGNFLMYNIFDNVDNKLIGSIDIDDSAELDEEDDNDTDDISIWINEHYRSGGRALEALTLLIEIYFKLHPERTSGPKADVALWNKASFNLFKKAGFQEKIIAYEGQASSYQMRFHKPSKQKLNASKSSLH